jgi:hypoxanthine phosphoribosyltransferase
MSLITYQEVYKKLEKMRFDLMKYDCIVGISRDWIMPATMLSFILHKPLFIAKVDRKSGKVEINWKPFGKILIVDDVYRTWWTVNTLKRKVKWDVLVLACDYNADIQYKVFDWKEFYIFEWEKADWEETYEVWYDLDWILCRDLKKSEHRLTYFPKIWVWYRSKFKLLFKPPENAVIITWRPECDEEITLKWLRKNGVYNKVQFNNAMPSFETIVKNKVWWIKRFKIKTYYESEEAQVKEIQKQVKDCKVLLFKHTNNV